MYDLLIHHRDIKDGYYFGKKVDFVVGQVEKALTSVEQEAYERGFDSAERADYAEFFKTRQHTRTDAVERYKAQLIQEVEGMGKLPKVTNELSENPRDTELGKLIYNEALSDIIATIKGNNK